MILWPGIVRICKVKNVATISVDALGRHPPPTEKLRMKYP